MSFMFQDGGGACKGEVDPQAPKQLPTDMDVVAHHNNSVDSLRETFHNFCGGAIIDFTPLSDNAAFAALRMGLPYFAICINEDHAVGMRDRLNDRMFAALTDPTSEFFEQAAVAELENKVLKVPGAKPKAKGMG